MLTVDEYKIADPIQKITTASFFGCVWFVRNKGFLFHSDVKMIEVQM